MKNVVVTYLSVGSAHRIQAESIAEYISANKPDLHVDLLDFVNDFDIFHFKHLPNMYEFITSNAFSSFFYDRVWHAKPQSYSPIYNSLIQAGVSPFKKFIDKVNPQVIVTTHVAATNIVSAFKAKSATKNVASLIGVVTDFVVGDFWPVKNVDDYIVPSKETFQTLLGRNFPRENIHEFGIPLRPMFLQKHDQEKTYKKYTLNQVAAKILVVMGGSAGTAYSRNISKTNQIISRFLELNPQQKVQFLIATGKSVDLKNNLTETYKESSEAVKVLGSLSGEEMAQMMNVADLVITKASGLTTSETLACGAALLLIPPFWGQERENADFLSQQGSAYIAEDIEQTAQFLAEFTGNKELREKMKQQARKLGKPNSTAEIVNLIEQRANQ